MVRKPHKRGICTNFIARKNKNAGLGTRYRHYNRVSNSFVRPLVKYKRLLIGCGTGACATFAAAKECGLVNGKTTLVLDGGELQIENSSTNGDVIMTGPAQTVFEGKIEI